eukprot:g1080.t1
MQGTHQQPVPQGNYVPSPGPLDHSPVMLDQYSYVDVNGVIQGPFSMFQIQDWIQQGHFRPSIHLRQGSVGIFQDLSVMGLMNYKEDPNSEQGRLERSVPYLEKNWYYIDRQGIQQGPFSYNIMYDWVVQGQLTPEIVARCGEVGPFTPIIKTAFMGVVPPVAVQPTPLVHNQMPAGVISPASTGAYNKLNSQEASSAANRLNTEVAELRKMLSARDMEIREAVDKMRIAQSENTQLKRKMTKLEEQSRANVAKIETLTIENQKMKRDKMAIKKQMEDRENKQKGSMKAYETAFRSISDIIERCKKDRMAGKSQYSSEKAPSSTSTTSGESSSASWANTAGNDDVEVDDLDDSVEEERILLSPSGVKVKQNLKRDTSTRNGNANSNVGHNLIKTGNDPVGNSHQQRHRQRRSSKDNKKANAAPAEKKKNSSNSNAHKKSAAATGPSSSTAAATPTVTSKTNVSQGKKMYHKQRNKNSGKSSSKSESKQATITEKQKDNAGTVSKSGNVYQLAKIKLS